jgi:3-oxoadipate enol-lactonase
MSAARTALKTAAIAAGVVAAASGAVKVVARQQRRHDDPHRDERFNPRFDRERMIDTFDAGTMYVVERGPIDGRPIVLCHGVTLSVRTWTFQFDALSARGYRVIAFDSRGHGRSQCGTAGHDVAHLATDLHTLIESLDLHDAVVVGHSMGGVATQGFAAAHPDTVRARVAGLVLLSTLARAPLGRVPGFVRFAHSQQRAGSRAFGGAMARPDIGFLMARVALGRNAAPSLVEFTREMVRECPSDTLTLAPLALAGFDLTREIEAIDVPVLVVCGTADLITPPAESRRIGRHIAHSRTEWIQGGGHMLMLERPDTVTDLIDDFARTVVDETASRSA